MLYFTAIVHHGCDGGQVGIGADSCGLQVAGVLLVKLAAE